MNKKFRPARLAVLLASIGGAAVSAADDAPVQLAPVIIKGNYDNRVGTTDAASAGTVTSKLIESRPALRPGEILEFVPGMIVTQHSGDGKANQYFLRGFNLDHGTDFATSIDNVPVNMRTHAHGQGYTDLNFLIPELVRRIDYQKGPYFAENGDFANAGAARIRLADRLEHGVASVSLGQNNYQRTLLANSSSQGAGNFLYALELGRNDGPWDTPENMRKYNGVLSYSRGNPGDLWRITGMGYKASWNASNQIPQRAVEQGLVSRYGTLDDSDGGETSRYSLSLDGEGQIGNGRYQASAYAVRSRLELFSNHTFALNHPADLGDPINGDQSEQAEKRRLLGFDLQYSLPTEIAGLSLVNRIGLQGRQDRLDPVALYATQRRTRAATVREDSVREGSVGLWVDNSTEWTSWFRSILGGRLDRYSFKVDSNLAENSGSADAQLFSPKLSLVFGPWSKTELFANIGRGFHSNDARGTVLRVSPTTGDPVEGVTPLVKTRGEELGLKTEWVKDLQSSVAFWRLKTASELIFVGDVGETEASRPSKRSGVEWNNHYVATPWLLFDADLAWSRARYADDAPEGNHIPGAIEKVASLGVSVDSLGPWSGQFQIRHFGARPLVEDNSVRSGSTTLAYLRTAYAFSKSTRLSLDIFNLFDRQASDIDYFYSSRLAGEPADGVADIHFHPVERRSVRLTLAYHF